MAPRYSRGYHPGYSMVSPLLLVLYGYGPYRCIPVPGYPLGRQPYPGYSQATHGQPPYRIPGYPEYGNRGVAGRGLGTRRGRKLAHS